LSDDGQSDAPVLGRPYRNRGKGANTGGQEGISAVSRSRNNWYDDDAGPMVRLYAMTGGRAQPRRSNLDIITLVIANTVPEQDLTLSPERAGILDLCRGRLMSVAEIAARSELPLSVVRVLLNDLLDAGHIRVERPTPARDLPSEDVLREVINGLRAL
jgi:uncharacterized protein DUF742